MKDKNEIKVMLKETAILAAITIIAGLMLGFVYELTKEPIALQERKAAMEACMAVFPTVDGSEIKFLEKECSLSDGLQNTLTESGVKLDKVYEAVGSDQSVLGYVIQVTSREGYGGDITLSVGITLDGKMNGVSILSISETPGLGMRAEAELIPQFSQKQVDQFTYTKSGSQSDSEIDAISGATITTKAVTGAVNGALDVAQELSAEK